MLNLNDAIFNIVAEFINGIDRVTTWAIFHIVRKAQQKYVDIFLRMKIYEGRQLAFMTTQYDKAMYMHLNWTSLHAVLTKTSCGTMQARNEFWAAQHHVRVVDTVMRRRRQ